MVILTVTVVYRVLRKEFKDLLTYVEKESHDNRRSSVPGNEEEAIVVTPRRAMCHEDIFKLNHTTKVNE